VALKAGVEPKIREWKGKDPMAFVISMNVMRRHLIPSQETDSPPDNWSSQ
jgi:hypothetical protein